jgi:RNA polymerase sigma factor (sigma-70 family)
MLGSFSEAEDVVQEAFLRFHEALERGTRIESPRSYLSTITTRTAIDHLRRARTRREHYVGEWLPERLLEDPLPEATERALARVSRPGELPADDDIGSDGYVIRAASSTTRRFASLS